MTNISKKNSIVLSIAGLVLALSLGSFANIVHAQEYDAYDPGVTGAYNPSSNNSCDCGYDPTASYDPTQSQSGYDPATYYQAGYDPTSYSYNNPTSSGYDPNGYDPIGYDPSGYDPTGYDPSVVYGSYGNTGYSFGGANYSIPSYAVTNPVYSSHSYSTPASGYSSYAYSTPATGYSSYSYTTPGTGYSVSPIYSSNPTYTQPHTTTPTPITYTQPTGVQQQVAATQPIYINNTNTNTNTVTNSAPVSQVASTPVQYPVAYVAPQVYTTPIYQPTYPMIYQPAPIHHVLGSSVALTQIPYTGFDFGPVGNSIYWAVLLSFAVASAYLLVYYRGGAFALATELVRGRSTARSTSTTAHAAAIAHDVAPVAHAEPVAVNARVASVVPNLPIAEARRATSDAMVVFHSKGVEAPRIVITRA
jgi:hypothetical protein